MKEKLYQLKNLVRRLIPQLFISWYHFGLAWFSAMIYRFPGKGLKVIAVTGTNGKSTVVEMLSHIFEEAGLKVASLSSIRFRILGREEVNDKRMTMPGRFFVQKFLKKAKDQGCSHVILEVTSEGIKQHRHRFIDFGAAVFTNLSPEHIESHGSFEKYRAAKGQLFKAAKNIHVLNLDDENIEFFLQFPSKDKWGYGIKTKSSSKTPHLTGADDVEVSAAGVSFCAGGTWFNIKLLGEFNIYNALAAIAAAQSQGISLGTCKKALEKMEGMPGRMEVVVQEPFRVLVDYAFTPNAIQKVYETISQKIKSPDPNSKMICVFGSCGGGRDKWRRPVLGEIASRFCHQIILTNEDPYDEDPMNIVEDVRKGIPNLSYEMFATRIILDRRMAIAEALKLARPGDVVVVTGKGCEPSICLAHGQRIPWDDRRVVREELSKIINR